MRRTAILTAILVGVAACAVPVPTPSARGRVEKPTPVTTTTFPATTTTATLPAPATLDEQVADTIVDLDEFWAVTLPAAYGVEYEPVTVLGGYDVDVDGPPTCGDEVLERSVARGNAFYCPADDTIAWDEEGLFRGLYDDFGGFAVSLVLAHEWGHAVQLRGAVDQRLPTIIRELQADCLAGAWTGTAMAGGGRVTVGPDQIDVATSGFLLFRDPTGTGVSVAGAHGNAFDRVGAFLDGVRNGAEVCVPYAVEETFPTITTSVFRNAEEVASGGNLPADEVFDSFSAILETYWAETAPELGITWDPFDTFAGIDAGCPGQVVPEEAAMAYCVGTDTLLLDDVGALQPLYENFGDFGPGFVIGLGWAEKVLALTGADTSTATAGLRADCLVGTWAGASVDGIATGRTRPDGEPEVLSLSPGDLDEAIQAILFLGDRERGPADAFERFEAFRRGFFGEVADC